jgi:hypothetical protein
MKKSTVIIILLGVLAISNMWWYFRSVEDKNTIKTLRWDLEKHRVVLNQVFDVLPVAARLDSTRGEVIKAATTSAYVKDVFEAQDSASVGYLGIEFQNNRVVKVMLVDLRERLNQ